MTVKILHNPRCSKSRQTLEILLDTGVKPEISEYLKTPPTKEELQQILNLLNIKPRQLMRTKEVEYTEMGLDDPSLSDAQLIAAMIATPKLIERPIVISNGKAAIGRPPETVLGIL